MGHGHKEEEDRDVAQQELSTDDDYQTELPKGSTSLAAAQAGDQAVYEAQSTASPFRLPPILFSSEHSEQKEKELRAKADAYNRSRLGRGGKNAAYEQMTEQANGYQQDAQNLDAANAAYNQLVPQSSFALDSVIRFKAIQEELGLDFADGESFTVDESDLTNHVADRKSELARGISDSGIKTNKGQVTDAAAAFSVAQSDLFATLTKLQGFQMRQVIHGLEKEKAENVARRQEIQKAIESARSVTAFVSKAIGGGVSSYAGSDVTTHDDSELDQQDTAPEEQSHWKDNIKPPPGYKDPKKQREKLKPGHRVNKKVPPSEPIGVSDVAPAADKLGGVAIEIAMHAIHDGQLADIDTKIESLNSRIQALNNEVLRSEVAAMQQEFNTAKKAYSAAQNRYENALASRRTAYAMAGARADKLHGGSLKGGRDKASQTMLFISAARETNVVLKTALPSGEHAEKVLRNAIRGMAHRAHAYLEDDWRWGKPEGGNTKDRQQLMHAFGLTTKWIEATNKEVKAFKPIEKAASAMLAKTGKTRGDY